MKRKNTFLLVFLLCFALIFLLRFGGSAQAEKRVNVYFANWNIYQDASGGQAKALPWDSVDGVYHAFWKIAPQDGGFALVPQDAWADTAANNPNAHFAQYARLTQQYPQVELMLSIGGWTCSGFFSQMALTRESRESFIQSCVDFLKQYPFFSGLDLDWEYPGAARKGSGSDEGCPVAGDDFTNYTLLLKELRSALDENFSAHKRLTVCAAGAVSTLKKQDYAALHPYVDTIHLMTYDLTGSYAGTTGHHTPLYGSVSADSAVQYLLGLGVPAKKLSLGTPLYTQGWKNIDLSDTPLGASASGKNKGGALPYAQLQALESQAVSTGEAGWHAGYDEAAQAAYLWNDDSASPYYRNFLSYESIRSLDAKLNYVSARGLGGLIVWQSGGDASGFPMIRRVYRTLHP